VALDAPRPTRDTERVTISLDDARAHFGPNAAGYLGTAALGLPTRETVAAMTADLDVWFAGDRGAPDYDRVVDACRAAYARLVRMPVANVAAVAQVSAAVSVIAADLAPGSEVIVVEGDFSSMVFPFLTRGDLVVRHVPVAQVADAVREGTALVSYSLVQSATGERADASAIREAAARVGARTLCDVTQAAGVMPVDASVADATVCHPYKWLCSPRGVAFLTISDDWMHTLRPIQAGWYAGDQVWQSAYGPEMRLAPNARRFDVSPAWPAWVGAEPALELFAALDDAELWRHAVGLGDAYCETIEHEPLGQAIVSIPDPDGRMLAAALEDGLRITGRAGRLRASFHLYNTLDDVERLARIVRDEAAPRIL
jgi:selenocysteine lyase/cysteine desulfurase